MCAGILHPRLPHSHHAWRIGPPSASLVLGAASQTREIPGLLMLIANNCPVHRAGPIRTYLGSSYTVLYSTHLHGKQQFVGVHKHNNITHPSIHPPIRPSHPSQPPTPPPPLRIAPRRICCEPVSAPRPSASIPEKGLKSVG